MSQPVPVIVVSYNTRDVLRACLQSLERSTLATQAFVVDNASTDGSAAMVRDEFPTARLIESEANLGFAKANNLALVEALAADPPWCLLLNPDAELTAGALEALVAFLQRYPGAGMVAPHLIYPDGSFQAAAFRFPTLAMVALDFWPPHGRGFGRLYQHPLNGRYREDGGPLPFSIEHPLGAAMLVRSQVLRDVGGFDEAFWLYAEEVEWCWRIQQAGWSIWQEPNATVMHHGGASSSQFRTRSFLALQAARHQLYMRLHSKNWLRAYRGLLRVAAFTKTLVALRLWATKQIDATELRRRSWAWAEAARQTNAPPRPVAIRSFPIENQQRVNSFPAATQRKTIDTF